MSTAPTTPLDDLFCVTASTRTGATVSDREQLALPANLMGPFLKDRLRPQSLAQGFVYLSTCHRVEIYAYASDPTALVTAWGEATQNDTTAIRILRGAAALEHFVRVAAGLESEIAGENQIMAQVRQALRESKERQILSKSLGHILQRGLRVARDIRSASRIGEGRENLSSLSLISLHEFFESLADKQVLVVGAGTMSLLAIEKLRELKVAKIVWINRSREKIEAHPYARFCRVGDYAQLGTLVAESDVSFFATSSAQPILNKSTPDLKGSRKGPPLRVLLDLGLPRNIDPEVQEWGYYLRNVDDFIGILNNQDALQKERLDYAEKVLRHSLESVQRDLDLSLIGPLKNEFLQKWKWAGEGFILPTNSPAPRLEDSEAPSPSKSSVIVVENLTQMEYNWQRSWAKLGHVFMTKANELGPLEGGQFLRQLCDTFDAFEIQRNPLVTTPELRVPELRSEPRPERPRPVIGSKTVKNKNATETTKVLPLFKNRS